MFTPSHNTFRVLFSVIMAATGVSQIVPHTIAFTKAASAAAELFRTTDRPSDIDPLSESGLTPEDSHGAIDFQNVQFSYPSRPTFQVLRGLDLHIPAGKTTALVGPSGCGKSTVVGLLERWYNLDEGSIRIDGRDITELNVRWLRSQIRLVQQVWPIYASRGKGLILKIATRNPFCSIARSFRMCATASLARRLKMRRKKNK